MTKTLLLALLLALSAGNTARAESAAPPRLPASSTGRTARLVSLGAFLGVLAGLAVSHYMTRGEPDDLATISDTQLALCAAGASMGSFVGYFVSQVSAPPPPAATAWSDLQRTPKLADARRDARVVIPMLRLSF